VRSKQIRARKLRCRETLIDDQIGGGRFQSSAARKGNSEISLEEYCENPPLKELGVQGNGPRIRGRAPDYEAGALRLRGAFRRGIGEQVSVEFKPAVKPLPASGASLKGNAPGVAATILPAA